MIVKKDYYNSRDSYIDYCAKTNNPIPIQQYLYIVNSYMKALVADLLENGQSSLPEKLGTLHVYGKKTKFKMENGEIKGLAPDWGETRKLWSKDEESKLSKQLVYHFNEDTNGVRYKYLWSKNRVLVSNKTLYTLKMTRANKRKLSSLIKGGKEYLIK